MISEGLAEAGARSDKRLTESSRAEERAERERATGSTTCSDRQKMTRSKADCWKEQVDKRKLYV